MDEIRNGYRLLGPFQNENAGFSRWTFAEKDGKRYFLKEFIDPVYPDEETLSDRLRQRRIESCKAYEKWRRTLYSEVNAASDGNLVRIASFFRSNSHYYLATELIDTMGLTAEEVHLHSLEDRLLLCRVVAHSIMGLHQAHIVHSDLKDSNILIKLTATGRLTAKIIDFDGAFFDSAPPTDASALEGDQVYLAPEACKFLCGAEDAELTCKMDVFSLGLLFHQYLTGQLPAFDEQAYSYAHEAVLDGQPLELSPELDVELACLLRQMLVCEPAERLSVAEVFHWLGNYFPNAGDPAEPAPAEPEPSAPKQPAPEKSTAGWFSPAGDL